MPSWLPRYFTATTLCLLLILSRPAGADQLTINSNASDPTQRGVWESIVEKFAKANPDIRVRLNVFDHESYKRSIRNWLTSASPDVVFWFAGNRMRQFARPGLLLDVSPLFTPDARDDFGTHAVDLVSHEGRQFGVPYAYYHIGFFYRKDLLQNAGVREAPRTWNELKDSCHRLNSTGVTAFALGTKDLWPVAAWFDYLNLRINGIEFHTALTDGLIPYTDQRLRPVFDAWRELIDAGCFSQTHPAMNWQESQALIYSGRAAMILIGSFIVPHFPDKLRSEMAFFPFPSILPDVPRYEEAPMNTLHIPARSKFPENAMKFLRFVMQPDVQETIAGSVSQIPANRRARIPDNTHLITGRNHIRSAAGLTQYFDRDANEELATIAMKGFQEFTLRPDRLDDILKTLEQARLRIIRK